MCLYPPSTPPGETQAYAPRDMFKSVQDLPVGPVARHLPANAGDTSLIPGPGRFHVLPGNKAHVPQLVSPTEPEGRNY